MQKLSRDQYSPEETKRRFENAIRTLTKPT
jgi:hypothetical protein